MKTDFFKRGLVVGIIVLFIGSNLVSGFNIQLKNTTIPMITNHGYIQDLIDDASGGDTIYIPSGTYYENIIINKSINLVGEDKDTTIIDGCWNRIVVSIVSNWVNISGFTIRNSGMLWDMAGIKIFSNHTIIMDNIISNNSCGINLDYSSNNIILNNNVNSNNYEGIILDYSNNNIIMGNNANSNNYYGIILCDSNNNNVTSNNASNNNLGILIDYSNNNIIRGNNANSNNYGGIRLCYSSNNNVTGNNANSNNYEGIYLCDSNNNNVTGNNASNNNNGILLYYSNNNIITSNTISWNLLGIDLFGSHSTIIKYNNFIRNNIQSRFEYLSGYYFLSNYWDYNYWDRPRILPKLIFGILWIELIQIPWIAFDWHPAKEPYDITTIKGCDIV